MDSNATHNFVTRDFVQKLGVTSITDATLKVTLADLLVVCTAQAAMLHLQLYDNRGCLIPCASTPVTDYILEVMPAPVVLGILWLQVNPKIDWALLFLSIGSHCISCTPSHVGANVEMYSV